MPAFNVTQASKIAGISRNTMYKKIRKGVISLSEDRQGNRVIEHAEILRVFGDGVIMNDNGIRNHQQQDTVTDDNGDDRGNTGGDGSGSSAFSILEARVTDLQKTVSILDGQLADCRAREERLLGLLETRLLTNRTCNSDTAPKDKKSKKSKKSSKKSKR